MLKLIRRRRIKPEGIERVVKKLEFAFEKESLELPKQVIDNLDRRLKVVINQVFSDTDRLDVNKLPYAMDEACNLIPKYVPLITNVRREMENYRGRMDKNSVLFGLGGAVAIDLLYVISYYLTFKQHSHLITDSDPLTLLMLVAIESVPLYLLARAYYMIRGTASESFPSRVPRRVMEEYKGKRDLLFSRIIGAYKGGASV